MKQIKNFKQFINESKDSSELSKNPTAKELAHYCYDNYSQITCDTQEERDEEQDFHSKIYDLIEKYGVDMDEFQDSWTDYADMMSDDNDLDENILVPRNIEGRKEKLKQLNIKLLSQEVIDGDLELDESFMDIDVKFVKIKKVNGSVRLNGGQWTEIPEWLKDIEITGSFDCSGNKLSTLKNCPQKIGKSFNCASNKLTSLEGCPENIIEELNCRANNLISLKGCPKNIGTSFDCVYNNLTSLEGCPEMIGKSIFCYGNKAKLILPTYVKLKGVFYN